MVWFALGSHQDHVFDPRGLGAAEHSPPLIGTEPDALLARGSIIVETRLSPSTRPRPLVRYDREGDWPFHLSLQSIPGGGLTLILDHGGEVTHGSVNHSDAGRMDTLRITYVWDAPRKWARLAVERTDSDQVVLSAVAAPRPMRIGDIRSMAERPDRRYLAPDILYFAVSDQIEPVGPMPTLVAATPVATPQGYVQLETLQRGDLVRTANGTIAPVLKRVSRTLPARGSFRPVRLRAPYFGLQRDLIVAPSQRLVITGSEVEYMFGKEAVLVRAGHLVGGTTAVHQDAGLLATYNQILLPKCDPLDAAGASAESLFIGRLRRKPALLAASLLSDIDRTNLPDHGQTAHQVLRAFDAVVLAEQRAA